MRLDATTLRSVVLCAWAGASCSATGNSFFDGGVDGSVSHDVAKSDAPVTDAPGTDAPVSDAPVFDAPPQPDAPTPINSAVAGPLSPMCLGCISTGCAGAGADCLGDAVCVRCVNVDRGDPACATNLAWRRMQSCACTACPGTCSTECVGVDAGPPLDVPVTPDRVTVVDAPAPPDVVTTPDVPTVRDVPTTGDVPTSVSAACTSCGTSRCLSQGLACVSDTVCSRCASTNFRDSACATNPRLQQLLACACDTCGVDCGDVCAAIPH